VTPKTIIVVTGAAGFIGKNLVHALQRHEQYEVFPITRDTGPDRTEEGLRRAHLIFHLAGINRPKHIEEYQSGNAAFTQELCDRLAGYGRRPMVVFASSSQAALENPYGLSKRAAEAALTRWAETSGGTAVIYRLNNVFGKWSRPNYNSVVATFCHNIARGIPIEIVNPERELELVYIDDIVASFMGLPARSGPETPAHAPGGVHFAEIPRSFKVSIGRLAALIQGFHRSRTELLLPSLADDFTRFLYGTYLSYLEGADFSYLLSQRADSRGSLAEFIKQPHFGQVFISRTAPGVTRGNHYHETKAEKFFVVEGQAIIRFRHVLGGPVIEHRVDGAEFKVLDIPPGYTHSIENTGNRELVTLFWASEIFQPEQPDTHARPVLPPPGPTELSRA